MEVRLGTRFFNWKGQMYRVKSYTDHFVLFESWYEKTNEWILITNPVKRDYLQKELEHKIMFLDTPTNRILYGANLPIEAL